MFQTLINNLPWMKNTAVIPCGGSSFLGFPHWYDYVCGREFDFMKDIPLIGLAVVDILLRIIGIVAIGYVVFGAIKYVVSQGEPDKVSEAKGTIINALVGMIIAALAVAIVSFIGSRVN